MLVFAMSFSRSQFHKKTCQSGSPVKVMMKRSSLGLKALAMNSYESYALMSWICSGRVFFLFWLVISKIENLPFSPAGTRSHTDMYCLLFEIATWVMASVSLEPIIQSGFSYDQRFLMKGATYLA